MAITDDQKSAPGDIFYMDDAASRYQKQKSSASLVNSFKLRGRSKISNYDPANDSASCNIDILSNQNSEHRGVPGNLNRMNTEFKRKPQQSRHDSRQTLSRYSILSPKA